MNEIINTNKGIRDGTDMIFDNKPNNSNDLSLDTILLSNLTVYQTTEWKEEKVNGILKKIPKDYTIDNLKNITKAEIIDGPHVSPKFIKNGYPMLSVNNIKNNKIDFKTNIRYVSKEDKLEYDKKIQILRNDILITKQATIGEVAIVEIDDLTIWSPLARIRIKDYFNTKYIYNLLKNKDFKNDINRIAIGSTQDNIGLKEIQKLKLFLIFDKAEQNKIRELLTKQEDIIENIDKRIEKTKKIIKYYQQELLSGRLRLREVETINGKEIVVYENTEWKEEKINGRVEIMPEDWYVEKLKNYNNIDILGGYAFKTKDMKNEGSYVIIKIGNIQDNKITISNNTQYTNILCEKYLLEKGDWIIGLSGAQAGKKGVFNLNKKSLLNQRNVRIRIKNDTFLDISYNEKIQKPLIETMKSMGIPNISTKDLENIDLTLPLNIEKILIRDFLTKLDNNLENLQNLKNKEEKTFKFLQQEFLSGKLRLK